MKTGFYTIEAVEVDCPECGEGFQLEGSYYMSRDDFDGLPAILKYQHCRKRFKKPLLPKNH